MFVCASILVFFRHRLGYGLGMAAGLIALPWFVLREISLASWNSWIFLNYEDPTPSAGGVYVTFVKLKILSAALIAVAVVVSSFRLFPARWSVRGTPLGRRTWPAFAVSFLMLGSVVCSLSDALQRAWLRPFGRGAIPDPTCSEARAVVSRIPSVGTQRRASLNFAGRQTPVSVSICGPSRNDCSWAGVTNCVRACA